MSFLIGVDAGGSKTAVIVSDGRRELARATGGPGAVRAGRALQAASRIAAAVRSALTSTGLLQGDVMVVGAAGVGRDPERSELREGLRVERVAERVIVTGDLDLALEAAFASGPGIVLIGGTGSVAVGRAPDGVVHRRGGLGWQMGDEGGAYAIARAALLAAGLAQDARGPAATFALELAALANVNGFGELVRWSTAANPGEVAALAPAVLSAAARGDPVAQAIATRAADDLAALVGALLPAFGDHRPVPVALAGGLLAPGRPLRAPVLERLRKEPRLAPDEHPVDAAQGALAIAARAPLA
ncbi:MAG TPA: BadF/BadG/BcrA/BcrD ATPase family protein [Gemmatimonadales bacterium]|nr:BadF/BadG/BcrA/BcrD ATPase family protein [Gemmatimonadales bacterium]